MIAFELLIALTKRLRKADEMIESLAFLDVRKRLLKYLYNCIKDEGVKDKSGFHKIKKHTHKELAARIGASREAITKILKVLAYKNIVIEKDKCFLISPQEFKKYTENFS